MDLPCVLQYQSGINQQCKLPSYLLEVLGVQIYDFIRITCSTRSAVVQVIPCDSELGRIEVNDVVCCTCLPENGMFSVTKLSTATVNRIQVLIVLRSSRDLCHWKSVKQKLKLISTILSQYGVIDNCTVKCRRHPVARWTGIDQINVLQTFIPRNQVGRVDKRTKIDISGVISREHFDQGTEFKKISIGGLSNSLSLMKEVVESYSHCMKSKCTNNTFLNEVLIVGPSGCGKSTLVKKTACDIGVGLEIIKCSKLMGSLPIDCELYVDSIAKKLSCMGGRCMLLIDEIDCIDDPYIVEVLFNLLLKMRSQNVMVIGTTTSTRKLYPHLRTQGIFHEQIRIGVPDYEDRKSILSSLIPQCDMNAFIDLHLVAKLTPGFVGADLSNAVLSVKRHKKEEKSVLDCGEQAKMTNFMSTEDFKAVLYDIKPQILQNVECNWSLRVRPVQWEDIGGIEKIKSKILKRIDVSLMPQDNLSKPWLPSTGGVLLYGPPGCCKTTLVCALATKWDATFFSANPAQIYSPYVGDSEKSIAQLFHQARLCAPAIIFLDELDCLVGKRATSSVNRDIQEKVLSALLNEMDGVCIKLDSMQGNSKTMLMEGDKAPSLETAIERKSNSGIVVIGATNRPDLIDDALLRPGRFDLLQYMGPPNKKERESILKTLLRKTALIDVDLASVAEETKYFSGADLQLLCVMAVQHAIRASGLKAGLRRADFEYACKKIFPSLSEEDIMVHNKFSEKCSQEI